MAVRRAIFIVPGHAEEVSEAIQRVQPKRILILGTSENMVHKIAVTLKLPAIRKIVRIEDIATKEEIEKARYYRLEEGKHIIPVPTIELKPHFSGYLIDPLETFLKKTQSKRRRLGEKSIVRPIFSYYGKLAIDDSAVESIIRHTACLDKRISKASQIRIKRIRENDEDKGIKIKMALTIAYGEKLIPIASETQQKIISAVEMMTGMVVNQLDIVIAGLDMNGFLPKEKRGADKR